MARRGAPLRPQLPRFYVNGDVCQVYVLTGVPANFWTLSGVVAGAGGALGAGSRRGGAGGASARAGARERGRGARQRGRGALGRRRAHYRPIGNSVADSVLPFSIPGL